MCQVLDNVLGTENETVNRSATVPILRVYTPSEQREGQVSQTNTSYYHYL